MKHPFHIVILGTILLLGIGQCWFALCLVPPMMRADSVRIAVRMKELGATHDYALDRVLTIMEELKSEHQWPLYPGAVTALLAVIGVLETLRVSHRGGDAGRSTPGNPEK